MGIQRRPKLPNSTASRLSEAHRRSKSMSKSTSKKPEFPPESSEAVSSISRASAGSVIATGFSRWWRGRLEPSPIWLQPASRPEDSSIPNCIAGGRGSPSGPILISRASAGSVIATGFSRWGRGRLEPSPIWLQPASRPEDSSIPNCIAGGRCSPSGPIPISRALAGSVIATGFSRWWRGRSPHLPSWLQPASRPEGSPIPNRIVL